jgi:hypothetical protein
LLLTFEIGTFTFERSSFNATTSKFFSQNFTNLLDKSMTYYDNYMVIEDLNYDLLCENKGKTLSELMELFGMSDLIKESIPPPCTSRSRLSILYPCTSKRLSLKVESNLVSDRKNRSTILSFNN